jgi:hypothetical protein
MAELFVPSELKLSSKESILVGVENTKTIEVINTNGLTSVFTPAGNSQVEFTFTSSESVDLTNSYFEADLAYLDSAGALVTNNSVWMNNFADCVDRVEMYVDGASVFNTSSREVSVIQNLLLLNEGSRAYLENEARVHLGYHSQSINNDVSGHLFQKYDPMTAVAVGATGGAGQPLHACVQYRGKLGAIANNHTRIHLPFHALHLALASMNAHLPMLGSQCRIIFHLNTPDRCIDTGAVGSTYQLTQARVYIQEVVLSADYKSSLMEQIASPTGLTINFFDYDIYQLSPVAGSTSHNFIVRNDHQSAKSLYIWDVNRDDALAGNKHRYPSMRSRIGLTTGKFFVQSGQMLYTGVNGSTSPMSHFNHLLKCAGHLADITPMGAFGFNNYFKISSDADQLDRVFAPLAVSLEKYSLMDTTNTIINSGHSSTGIMTSRDIEVRLDNMTEAWDADWQLFSCLLHQKSLVFANRTLSVVD